MDALPGIDAQVVPSGSLTMSVVEFCRVLNEHGIFVPPASSLTALEALHHVAIGNRAQCRAALCASLINRPEDIPVYTVLFDTYWRLPHDHDDASDPEPVADDDEEANAGPAELNDELIDDVLERFSLEAFLAPDDDPESADDESKQDGAEYEQAPGIDRASLSANDPRALQRLVRALARHFATRRSRRFETHHRGALVDLRRSMRHSIKTGGIPIELRRRRRQTVRNRLVLFVDVSRSMASYAKLLMQFVAAVLRHAWHVEVYLFASKLIRVTHQQLEDNEVNINEVIAECGGGTRIGDNILTFERDYGHALTGNQSIVIVLSDGLDSGEPERLERAMSALQRRARQVIWLNPLLGVQGYDSTARSMAAAMPFIDVFAPAHDTACLWNLLDLLKSSATEHTLDAR